MILDHVTTYHGPNPLSPRPVVVVSFTRAEPLWRAEDLPRLASHLREDPFEGLGSDERDDPAVHVLRLTQFLLRELGGRLQDHRIATNADRSCFVLGFFSPQVSLAALRLSLALLRSAATAPAQETIGLVADFLRSRKRDHPDYQANILMDYAEARSIPFFQYAPRNRFWQFGWGSKAKVYVESLSTDDSAVAFLLQRDKLKSKSVFRALGVPTPAHVLVADSAALPQAEEAIGYPCVVKPIDRGGGKGVTADVGNSAELYDAFAAARTQSAGPILVEQWVAGEEHRLMVVNGEFVCAIRRNASAVTGDGRSTIATLIDRMNASRNLNPASGELRPLLLDGALERHLGKKGYSLDSVLPAGADLPLRSVSNLSMGGIPHDVTGDIHPDIRAMVEHIARTLDFGTVGFDYITSDIGKPPLASGGAFIEMNTTPGLDICLTSTFPIDRLLDKMFADRVGRIPVRLVVLPAGASVRLSDPKRRDDHAVVHGTHIRVGTIDYRVADADGWAAVKAALRNRTVGSLDIYASSHEIVARGLPLDRLDRIVLADPAFPAHWLPLLERCADRFLRANSEDRIVL